MTAVAACSDIRTRRIPNWITAPGAVAGLILQTYYGGLYGSFSALAGACLGLGIFGLLYLAGGMGAGDAKLFGAVGALVGPWGLILAFVFTGLLGGMAAGGLAFSRGCFWKSIDRAGHLLLGKSGPADAQALHLPYGAIIAAGTLLSILAGPK